MVISEPRPLGRNHRGGPGRREAHSSTASRRNPTPPTAARSYAEPSQCLYVSTKTGVDRARPRRCRTHVMPSPDRYRNTLWIVTAAWIGATAILTWLSYGDAARRIIASSYPRLGWLAPSPAPIARSAPDMTSLAAEAAPSPVQQRLNAMSLDLEAMRRSGDRILIAPDQ